MDIVDFTNHTWARTEALRVALLNIAKHLPAETRRGTIAGLLAAAQEIDGMNAEQPSGKSPMEESTHNLNVELRKLVDEMQSLP